MQLHAMRRPLTYHSRILNDLLFPIKVLFIHPHETINPSWIRARWTKWFRLFTLPDVGAEKNVGKLAPMRQSERVGYRMGRNGKDNLKIVY